MFARAYGSAIRPITLGRHIIGIIQNHDSSVALPSSFVIKLNTQDHNAFSDIETHLVRELAEAANQFAELHKYKHDYPISVKLIPSSETKKGSFEIVAEAIEPTISAKFVLDNGERRELTGTSLKVGRQATCRIVFDDSNVSREHAQLHLGPDGWMILDLASTNGTKVNGLKIDGEQLLVNGDELDFGTSHARFEIS